jgi:hypothetical protein
MFKIVHGITITNKSVKLFQIVSDECLQAFFVPFFLVLIDCISRMNYVGI